MNLTELCQKITLSDRIINEDSFVRGDYFLNAGFLKGTEDVKRYPFVVENRKSYIYLWDFSSSDDLLTTMCPPDSLRTFSCHFTDGQMTPPHIQEFVELAYVVKGELTQKILGKDVRFQEGEFCLIDRNCEHQDYLFKNKSIILFLCIKSDALLEVMNENLSANTIITFLQAAMMEQKEIKQYIHFKPTGDVRKEMEECLSLLLKEHHENKVGGLFVIKGLVMRIFRLLSTRYEFQLSKQQKKDMNSAIFEEICRYIGNHSKTVTIQELSEVFHFQEDYFNRLIKKRTGSTYCEMLQEIRLYQAEKLLVNSEMTISEIAEEVGYKNKGYFYKLFEAKHGVTPAEYRKAL